MAYTITLTSTAETEDSSDTCQIILVFNVDDTGANQSYSFADKNLVIMDRGKLTWSYDLEDALIMPQIARIKISDKDGYVTDLLFGTDTEPAATEKQFSVEIKRTGTQVFKGTALEDSIDARLIDSAGSSYELIFEAAPQVDILNSTSLYDARTGDILDPLSYGVGATKQIQAIILDIYQEVNASISLNVEQNWLFSGTEIGGMGTIADSAFDEIWTETDHVWQDNVYGVGSLGDALKFYAKQFGCFTGFTNFDNAFFRKLFHYDSGNTQTLGTVDSVTLKYFFNKIEFVRLINPSTSAVVDTSGAYTEIESKKIDIDDPFFPGGAADMTFIKNGGTDYRLEDIEDDDFQASALPYDQTFTDYWFNFRGDITKLRVEEFQVVGVDYDITKNFTYTLEGNAFKYQPIELAIDWENGTSRILALNLGT